MPGRRAPSSENTLVPSLGEQCPLGFVNEKEWKINKSIQLANSSNNIDSGLFFLPWNSSRLFKATQKLFAWQKPNLTAGWGWWPAPRWAAEDHQKGVEKRAKFLLHPSRAASKVASFWPFPLPASGHLHSTYPSPSFKRWFCFWKVPSCVWQLSVATLNAKATGTHWRTAKAELS